MTAAAFVTVQCIVSNQLAHSDEVVQTDSLVEFYIHTFLVARDEQFFLELLADFFQLLQTFLQAFSFGNKDNKDAKEQPEEKTPQEKINTKQILKLTEETISKNYIMADCCHPIPGDDVLGYIDEQNRVVIHKRQCPVATRLKSSYGNRIIATEWDTHKDLSFLVTIYIKGIDSMGLLNEVTQVISRQLNVNIRKLTIETNDGIFEGKIQLYVHDVDDVRTICNNLKQIQNIKQVTRVEE